VKNVQTLTGKAETFVVETCRHEELGGDFIFIECMDENGVTRLALPPKLASVIASQRDSLTARRRSMASKATAQARKARGELPGFLRRKARSLSENFGFLDKCPHSRCGGRAGPLWFC
jgi:hypothetical protein